MTPSPSHSRYHALLVFNEAAADVDRTFRLCIPPITLRLNVCDSIVPFEAGCVTSLVCCRNGVVYCPRCCSAAAPAVAPAVVGSADRPSPDRRAHSVLTIRRGGRGRGRRYCLHTAQPCRLCQCAVAVGRAARTSRRRPWWCRCRYAWCWSQQRSRQQQRRWWWSK